ncbi:guanitoxin biosynthesis heme-dependent pre-guanitoxin N-hydroxylase GntA [Erythrobacter donghaensis]|jgi:FPC/CPF motif-containing protein YcgG|uniref:guanitoxin biosynthesis heme-dependent pre-guanitoxin N-hydroxylase GntA n=1 Tax=Erythrobacter donghaensis TaxID=267135 RepID=UPI00093C5D3A|nr:guanitoxin biosynthesis heme-dependent pre-guanitoxin N-hydroxylase GntA [Erythrobacter donghaensis]
MNIQTSRPICTGGTAEVPDPRLAETLRAHIAAADFPCVGAKSALAQDGLHIETAGAITRGAEDVRLHRALVAWGRRTAAAAAAAADDDEAPHFRSFAVVFAGPNTLDERAFEAAFWERLARLSAIDRAAGFAPEPGFSSDPDDPHFALGFGGRAYFAVGLHPRASRRARRLAFPAIIFNPHEQFARLRAADRYERMRAVILARDAELDGAPNPMLARHGTVSEARQYSGRAVGPGWVCPFAPPEAP